MDYDKFEIRNKINDLYIKLAKSAATFIYNPNEIKEIKQEIFELQNKCNHEYQNGRCIYCKKDEE